MDILSFKKGSIFENGFGIVGKVVMQDRDISIQSKAIYSYICTYANNENKAFPSLSKISYDLSISTTSVTKYLKELIAKGYVTKTQDRQSDGTFSKNIYTIELFTAQPTDVSADTVNDGDSNAPSTDNPLMGEPIVDTPISDTPVLETPIPDKADMADLTTNNTSISKNTSTQKNNNLKIQDNKNLFKVVEVFTQSIYKPSEDERKSIELWTQMVEPELVIRAIAVAVKHNHKSYDYFEIVLTAWYERGIRTTADLEKKINNKRGNGGIKNGITITTTGKNSGKELQNKAKQVSGLCGKGAHKEDRIDIDNPGKYGLI